MGRSNLRNKHKKRKSRSNPQNRRETNYYGKDRTIEY